MYKNILIPVTLDKEHDTTASFAAARQLADANAAVTVVHVQEPIPAFVGSQIPGDVLTQVRQEVLESLDQKASGMPGAKAQLITGHAGRAIVDYAEENKIDCIILASHKPAFGDLLLGSTANRVVHHARCSVHVIR